MPIYIKRPGSNWLLVAKECQCDADGVGLAPHRLAWQAIITATGDLMSEAADDNKKDGRYPIVNLFVPAAVRHRADGQ